MGNGLQHTVAAEVRAELARQRRTQRELASALGISGAQISKRLAGDLAFDVAELEKTAEFLDVPVSQFVSPVSTRGAA